MIGVSIGSDPAGRPVDPYGLQPGSRAVLDPGARGYAQVVSLPELIGPCARFVHRHHHRQRGQRSGGQYHLTSAVAQIAADLLEVQD